MKIEWTDAACNEAALAFRRAVGVNVHAWRAALDAATAEQFRPETTEEKCKRLETALRAIAGGCGNASFVAARALYHDSKESGT